MATQPQDQKNSQSQDTAGSDDFTIRTMHSDLSNPGSFMGDHTEKDIEPVEHEPARVVSNSILAPKSASPFSQEISENTKPASQPIPQPQKNFSQNNSPVAAFPAPAKEIAPAIPAAKPIYQPSNKKSSSLFTVVIIAIVVLVIIALGAGSYHFFFAKNSKPVHTQVQPEQNTQTQNTPPQTQNEIPVTINPPTEKYSSTNPNYLPLDIAGSSNTDILKTLSDISPDIETSSATVPIEFSVVDKNNNPVVFHIFAAALKLNLSPDVLASLGDNFSLYYFKTASSVIRLGMSVDVNDPVALKTALAKEEPALPTDLAPMFLGASPIIKTGLFNDSSYDNFAIRYLNLDIQSGLSIDYTITNKQFVMGTSKDTLRSILDKLSTATTTAPAASSTVQNQN